MNKLDEFYDFLIENGICSEDFVSGAVCRWLHDENARKSTRVQYWI